MLPIMIWFVGALGLAAISGRAFADLRSSRFVRFLAEVTLWALLVMSGSGWFRGVLSIPQIVSWMILAVSLALALSALYALQGVRRSRRHRPPATPASQISTLVTTGPYKYVRHPLYTSLILLGWGAAFKLLSFFSISLALITTALLFYCSYLEELENLEEFGEEYDRYMETTRMFIPGLF